jgi:succinate dehydrogenase/fumarate reductase cytochrome b subunit
MDSVGNRARKSLCQAVKYQSMLSPAGACSTCHCTHVSPSGWSTCKLMLRTCGPTANTLERYASILTMLTGNVFFGFIVGNITSIVATRNSVKNAFYKTMDELHEFMQVGACLLDCYLCVHVCICEVHACGGIHSNQHVACCLCAVRMISLANLAGRCRV